jgi:hypothetical protein
MKKLIVYADDVIPIATWSGQVIIDRKDPRVVQAAIHAGFSPDEVSLHHVRRGDITSTALYSKFYPIESTVGDVSVNKREYLDTKLIEKQEKIKKLGAGMRNLERLKKELLELVNE